MAAFKRLATDNRSQREYDAKDGCDIHVGSVLLPLRVAHTDGQGLLLLLLNYCAIPHASATVLIEPREGASVNASDILILDAKQAILEEQHRRFQELQADGNWQAALPQLQQTLTCASDLLQESLTLLEAVLNRAPLATPPALPPDTPV